MFRTSTQKSLLVTKHTLTAEKKHNVIKLLEKKTIGVNKLFFGSPTQNVENVKNDVHEWHRNDKGDACRAKKNGREDCRRAEENGGQSVMRLAWRPEPLLFCVSVRQRVERASGHQRGHSFRWRQNASVPTVFEPHSRTRALCYHDGQQDHQGPAPDCDPDAQFSKHRVRHRCDEVHGNPSCERVCRHHVQIRTHQQHARVLCLVWHRCWVNGRGHL